MRLGCSTGKRGHPTQYAADHALLKIWAGLSPGQKHPVRSYHCDRCNEWHLTSMSLVKYNQQAESSARTKEVV